MAEFDDSSLDLGPTAKQLAHSFGWAAFGLAVGLLFLFATMFSQDPVAIAMIMGVCVIIISLVSAVAEYLDLPGVQLRFSEKELEIQPNRKPIARVPYAYIDYICLEPGPHVGSGEPEDIRKLMRRQFSIRPRGLRRPHWYLTVAIRNQYRAKIVSERYAVGGDVERVLLVERACQLHGVNFKNHID